MKSDRVLSAFLILIAVATPVTLAQRAGTPAQIRAADVERIVHDRVNDQRVARKLNALGADRLLSAIARAHSEDMAKRNFFSHVNPEGEDPTARGKRARYECHKELGRAVRDGLAENLYEGSLSPTINDIGRASVREWLNSPEHRRNILEKRYDRSGVGVAISGNRIYITQLFC